MSASQSGPEPPLEMLRAWRNFEGYPKRQPREIRARCRALLRAERAPETAADRAALRVVSTEPIDAAFQALDAEMQRFTDRHGMMSATHMAWSAAAPATPEQRMRAMRALVAALDEQHRVHGLDYGLHRALDGLRTAIAAADASRSAS